MKKKLMSFPNISETTANALYHVSFLTLIAGTALVLFSAIALIWSSSVRERDTAQRLANMSAASAQANAALLKAKADVAEANRQLALANATTATAKKEAAEAKLENEKAPAPTSGREITLENSDLFLSFVKNVAKGRIIVEAIASDPEASHFAGQMSDMLKTAGYDVVDNFGSPTLLGAPPVGVQMKIRSMEEQPVYAGSLQKGLEFIGIDTTGSLDSTAGDSVMIFVGSKP